MRAILVYVLAVAFVVLPATLIYGLVLLVTGGFTRTSLTVLGSGGALILVAILLFLTFGKRLVVK